MTAIVGRERVIKLCTEFLQDRPRLTAWLDYAVMQELMMKYDGKTSVEQYARDNDISAGKFYDALKNREAYEELKEQQ